MASMLWNAIVLSFYFTLNRGIEVKWSISLPKECVASDTMSGVCARSRTVQCVKTLNGQIIPDYYCNGVSTKPSSFIECDAQKCAKRCVVSMWSPWEPCDVACFRKFSYRTRSVLWRDNDAVTCPPLLEKSPCAKCSGNSNEFYLWEVGDWGECRAFTMVQVYDLSFNQSQFSPSGSDVCGPDLTIGKATRKVRCIDANGVEKEAKKCLNSKDKDGRITQRPDRSKVCELTCDCHLSTWSQWNGCPADCSRTEESRTRGVLYPPRLGGKACGPLVETRPCTTKCPSYKWYTSSWGVCTNQDNLNGTVCGNGFNKRAVFCVRSNSATKANETMPVGDHLCDVTARPVERRLCHMPCPRDCVVSAWGTWEPCSITCGGVGIKKRMRSIIEAASQGGMDCPTLIQMSSCKMPPCVEWAVALKWGPCFPRARCGQGNKGRVLVCRKSSEAWVNENFCPQPKPIQTMNCTVPCPNDCVLSEWEQWGSCSRSCGSQGGVQTRKRTILAYPSSIRAPCPSKDELIETRKCNAGKKCEDEAIFMWKTSAWQPCQPRMLSCGASAGVQTRKVHCGNDAKNIINDTVCGNMTKPSVTRMCDIPCPKDCVFSRWGNWTKCNATCELAGTQISKRYVLQTAKNGGRACPEKVINGVEQKYRRCVNVQPCYNYTWEVTPWNVCEILPQMKLKPSNCGAGYQTRNVSCVRSDGKLVQMSYCFESTLKLPPKTLKECWKPCDKYCVRTSWTEWTGCPNTCTTSTPAVRRRNRQVVNLSPARGGFSTDCPSLTHKDFTQTETCPKIPCKSYAWFTAPYTSCIPYNSLTTCGKGKKERHVLCQDQFDFSFVEESFCDEAKKPNVWVNCFIDCTQDCEVSSWSQWDLNCSSTCGKSLKRRQRTVLKQPVGLGRACPRLLDKQLCQEPSCSSFKWSVGSWSICALASPGSVCGNGTQARQVVCTPHPDREWICAKQAEKPPVVQDCFLSCPGDCVVTPWSTWSDYVPFQDYCFKMRHRKKARGEHMTSTKKCSSYKMQEQKNFTCPNGTVVTSDWTTCLLSQTVGQYCGKGTQYRSVKCEGENGVVLDRKWCPNIDSTSISRDCEIPCRVDCVVGDWSEWSRCSASCGRDGMMKRSRKVIVSEENGGRKCPEVTQSRPCNNMPCYTYQLNEGDWGKCYVDGQGCGQGVQSRETTCRRSDGKIVSLHFCFGQLTKTSNDAAKLNLLQVVINNSSQLLMTSSRTCDESCPGDCDMSDWSEWSECGRNCFENSTKYYQTRSRVIISSPDAGGKACSSELLQTRDCQSMYAVDIVMCIGAHWRSGTWVANGTREVWCETSSGVKVTGACAAQNKPSETKSCSPACSDPNSICHEGQCVCKTKYEMFQGQCILTQGCLQDGHCIEEHTVCQNQKCSCKINYSWNKTAGSCVPAPQQSTDHLTLISSTEQGTTVSTDTVSTRLTDTTPDITQIITERVKSFSSVETGTTKIVWETSTTQSGEKEALGDEETISAEFWKWIGIGAGVLVLFLVLAIGFYCYSKRQRKAKHRMMKLKRNTIELVGVMTFADDYKSKPYRV